MKRLWIFGLLLALVVGAGGWLLWPRSHRGLVVYCAVDYCPGVATAFSRSTGIPVQAIRLTTGALLARVSAEGKRPSWTLVWFDGDEAAAALDRAGLLALHTAPALPWTAQGRSLLPADGSYTPTGLTLAGAFTYRKAALATPPQTWKDLLDPALQGAIGMNNPAISGPMYPLLAGLLSEGGGWPAGQSLVLALKQHGLHVYPKNANTLAALQTGDIKVAITQSSAAWSTAAENPALGVVVPKPAFALPSVLAIAAGASPAERAAAERFIRFAMTPAIQHLRMTQGDDDGDYWPLVTGVPVPAGLPPLASIALKPIDPRQWGPLEAAVNRWFSRAVVGQ